MRGRSHLTERERSARSRLTQLLHQEDLVAGSTVLMRRTCGKETCKCTRGEKHVSLYLAFNRKNKRTMVCIPAQFAQKVSVAVENYKLFKSLLQTLSQECYTRLVTKRKE